MGSNYAFNPIAEQALRSDQTIVPQRVNAALALMEKISVAQFLKIASPLVGLNVGCVWTGYGKAIFLELGRLLPPDPPKKNNPRGEMTIMLDQAWRVEGARSILFGSMDTHRRIKKGLASLEGRTVEDIAVVGRLPELSLKLSGGKWVSSFAVGESQPDWGILLPDRKSLGVRGGTLIHRES